MDTLMNGRKWMAVAFVAFLPGACWSDEATKVLHFPADQYVGRLSVEDPCLGSEFLETGRDLSYPFGFDPKRVCLTGDWDFVGSAQGAVAVPADRRTFLVTVLQPAPADRARLSRLGRDFLLSRVTADPVGLSGLSQLDPNDLYQLRVCCVMKVRDMKERVLEPISCLTGLEILGLSGAGITDRQMEYLRPLQSLRALELTQETSLRNSGLTVLKDLPALEYLDLDCAATDIGLKHLGTLKHLRWLRLRTGRAWGPGLAELANAPRLERLCLWGETGLSDRQIHCLEGLTQLKSLTLWGTTYPLTDASLASIGKLTNLEELYFIRIATKFTDAGIAHLKNLKNLRRVDFAQAMVGDEGVRQLATLLALEAIEGGLNVTAEGMKTLGTMSNLRCLHVGLREPMQGYRGPTGIEHLAGLTNLEELVFSGGSVSDEDLRHLESLTNLRSLLVSGDDITDQGLASLAKLDRLESLTLWGRNVTKRGLNELRGLTNLQTLNVRVRMREAQKIDETPLQLSSLKHLKTLELTGVGLQDADLAILDQMHEAEWVIIGNGTFSEAGLSHLRNLASVKHLRIGDVDCTTGAGLAWLSELDHLGGLWLQGRIPDQAVAHLAGLPSLWSLHFVTDEAIRPETQDALIDRLPALQHLHVDVPWRPDTTSNQTRKSRRRPELGSSRRRQEQSTSRRRR